MSARVQLLVPAAGLGTRLGANAPKALVDLAGEPVLVRTLRRFAQIELLNDAILTIPASARELFANVLSAHFGSATIQLIDGGPERQDSVANGLAVLNPDTEIVVIHDAARPFVSAESIRASIAAAEEFGAATVAIPSVDTVLVADDDGFLQSTPDRKSLWSCQTPQTFRVDVLREAHERAKHDGFAGTDDASLVRRMGGKVKLVMGSPLNFKVTTPQDLALACRVIEGALA